MRTLLVAAILALSIPCFADPASAQWDANHPRRAQVNSRLANQNQRIDNGVKDGRLTQGQAAQLHREDHAIRTEERADAAANGGHITKAQQAQINRQENRTSRQIYREKH